MRFLLSTRLWDLCIHLGITLIQSSRSWPFALLVFSQVSWASFAYLRCGWLTWLHWVMSLPCVSCSFSATCTVPCCCSSLLWLLQRLCADCCGCSLTSLTGLWVQLRAPMDNAVLAGSELWGSKRTAKTQRKTSGCFMFWATCAACRCGSPWLWMLGGNGNERKCCLPSVCSQQTPSSDVCPTCSAPFPSLWLPAGAWLCSSSSCSFWPRAQSCTDTGPPHRWRGHTQQNTELTIIVTVAGQTVFPYCQHPPSLGCQCQIQHSVLTQRKQRTAAPFTERTSGTACRCQHVTMETLSSSPPRVCLQRGEDRSTKGQRQVHLWHLPQRNTRSAGASTGGDSGVFPAWGWM